MFWFNPKKNYWFNPTDYGLHQSQASITPASFPQAPLTWQQEAPKQAPVVPQQAMQTYAPPIENESRTYKGLSTEDETKLMKLAGGSSSKADMLYPKLLQYKQDNLFLQDRKIRLQEAQLEAIQSGDKRQKETTNQMVKIGQLADFIREDALKNGALWVSMKADEEIVNSILAKADTRTSNKLLTEYFNGNTDTETVANVLLGRKPELEQSDAEWMSTLWKIWVGALWAVGTLIWWKVWGEIAKSVGKKIYWLTLPPTAQEAWKIQSYKSGRTNIKPKTTIDTALEQPLFTKWNKRLTSISDKFWLFGTRSQIWVQAEAIANNMFQEKISPIFQQSLDEWLTINYDDLFNQAKESVQNNKKRSVEQKTAILEDITEIQQEYKWTTTLENLDKAKRDIANKLPAKYFKGAPMTNTVKDAQWTISSVFRNTVHDTIKSRYWVDSAKIYAQYADLKLLWAMWQKAMTQAWLQWGAWTFLSTTAQELATPVTTTVWKVTYKIGDLFSKPTDYLIKKGRELIKSGKVKDVLKIKPWTMAGASSPDINELRDDFHNAMVADAQEAIRLLNEWKDIPITNNAYLLWDKLSKEEKIAKLNKVVNSKAPKKIVTPFEYLIDKIF